MSLRDSILTIGQLTGYNSLYYKTDLNKKSNIRDYTTRVNPSSFMYVPPQNQDINMEVLNINGRIGQQDLRDNVIKSRPLNLYENGRDLAIFRKTNYQTVDTSGTIYINQDMKVRPIAMSYKLPVYGIIGV